MIPFAVKVDEMKAWFPKTYKSFIKELRKSKSLSSDKPEDEIEWMVSWGFFSKKAKTEEEAIQKQIDYDNKLKLVYKERCKADIPKIRINISMKAGYRITTDRSIEKNIPEFIIDMSYEVLKITMLQEQLTLNDPTVMESLAEFQHLMDDILDEIKEMGLEIPEDMEGIIPKSSKNTSLNMDEILDKISENGMSSLSAKELKFLEKMSKGNN